MKTIREIAKNNYATITKKVLINTVLIFSVLFSFIQISCSYGRKIRVDRPEVFTRERLINQRLQERHWLEGKLKEKYEPGFQGIEDLRQFKGLLASFQGVFEPHGGKLIAERISAERAELMRQSQINTMKHQIELEKLKKEMYDLKTDVKLPPPVDSEESGEVADTGNTDETPITTSSYTPSDYYKGVNTSFKSDGYPKLIDPSTIKSTLAKKTGLERLRDEKAYRDAIQAMISETDLDDSHDLYGNTIYTLKFDVSIAPKKDDLADQMGEVYIDLKQIDLKPDDYKNLFRQWKKVLENEIRLELASIQSRYDLELLTELEMIDLYIGISNKHYWEKKSLERKRNPEERKKSKAKLEKLKSILESFKADIKKNSDAEELIIEKEIQNLAYQKYRVLEKMITLYDPYSSEGHFFYTSINKDEIPKNIDELNLEIFSKKNIDEILNDKINELKKLNKTDFIEEVKKRIKSLKAIFSKNWLTKVDKKIDEVKKSIQDKNPNLLNDFENLKNEIYQKYNSRPGKEIKDSIVSEIVGIKDILIFRDKSRIKELNSILSSKKSSPVRDKNINDLMGRYSQFKTIKNNIQSLINLSSNNKDMEKKTSELRDAIFSMRYPEIDRNLNELKKSSYKLDTRCQKLIGFQTLLQDIAENIGNEITVEKQYLEFVRNVKRLEQKKSLYVYNVEPKEYAQNISQVQASEKLKNLVLSLKAVLPVKGIKAGGYVNQLKRSQSMLHSILRKPLVVGYIEGEKRFGWLFGPRFQINKRQKVKYEFVPVQHSLRASIVAPAWQKEIELIGKYKWNGFSKKFWKDPIKVQLPRNLASLTTAFLDLEGQHRLPPYIQPKTKNDSQLYFHAKSVATVLIKGKRMWRNPQVFIGSQKAFNVEILPNMGGLLASFGKIIMPAHKKTDEDPKVDLSVITSNGSRTLRQVITILKPLKEKKQITKNDFATIMQLGVYSGGKFKVSVPTTLIPKKVHQISLLFKPKKGKEWVGMIFTNYDIKLKGKTKEITFNGVNYDKNEYKELNAETVAEIKIQEDRLSSSFTIPAREGVSDSFIFFENEDMFKLQLASPKIDCSEPLRGKKYSFDTNIKFIFGNRELFLKARPDLKKAIKKGFSLEFKVDTWSAMIEVEKIKKHFEYNIKDKNGIITIIGSKLNNREFNVIEDIIEFIKNKNQNKFKILIKLPNGKEVKIKPGEIELKLK